MKKCIDGKKHKWDFIRHVKKTVTRGNGMQISLHNQYKCTKCGAVKIGPYTFVTKDLSVGNDEG